ncbi:MAG: UDP-N-acetylmuramoyl-L-alanyl-D-glutamate-2, 6-diaminopimelate ligase [uncultured bacterium]|uniref:UDP-N-acetylmuramyl-tripeptide synthetase n=1 Tax=Candidatus Woesebacteria bacterium RIFCSPLOWO2_01_FULL_39_21 TaxID=1802519 RepID=A0A1F8BE85_9BACT|nr:MAG: UDP-N-acetylmuramoyl-L-alanyl-D-glutamate-2, 6-diaminopimelate ligase [uncultured bacterium]OGM22524.1 MAG: hypothetical protein A2691_04640 [Candidatus Woesebacteria bacterium RIFCSPHIGHO2_01_FULL_39_23]OGM61969.1 MAG: hypothetical protein A2961_02805 [Candidatus Woesebacteria bacterium RIFCSPLOWO2_01_FULL_39_21]
MTRFPQSFKRIAHKIKGDFASYYFGQPSKKLKFIGVTGTDGKSTTATLIYWIIREANKKVGLITTLGAKIGDKNYDTGFHVTTPEPIALQKFLSKMVKAGCKYAVLEVTSHGLDQSRVAGINFDVGVLTNITHEHLDYHKTWQNYRNAKALLFKEVKTAVLNRDDSSFDFIVGKISKNATIISYAIDRSNVDYFATHIDFAKDVSSITLEVKEKLIYLKTSLPGLYNVSNTLAAVAACRNLGIEWKDIKKALSSFKPLEGRLEKVNNKKGFGVYIDFAHTPNALEKVLCLVRKSSKGRVIAIFGCAGERDIQKRPMMGHISSEFADVSVFTAEDPRSEDVNKIIMEIEQGVRNRKTKIYKIPDRGRAIWYAINKIAQRGDTVVICGKGHEKSMAYKNVEYPWSDRKAVRFALEGKALKLKK